MLAPHVARAQTAAEPAQIVLPSRMIATEPATLSVLDKFGRLVPRIQVNFSDGTHTETDITGRAYFNAPSQPGPFIARFATQPAITACGLVLPHEAPGKLRIDSVPAFASLHDRFEIRGTGFRGDSVGNRVQFRRDPALLLAASPRSLVILLGPHSEPGLGELEIAVDDAAARRTVTALDVEFDASGQTIAPGVKAKLIVRVRGTDQPVLLDVQNLAPGVLQFLHGNDERAKTRAGVDNSTFIHVRGVHEGDFSFRVRILSTQTEPDYQAAREYLIAAQKDAPMQFARRLDPIARRLERPRPDAALLLKQLDKTMESMPDGDFGIYVHAARAALRGE